MAELKDKISELCPQAQFDTDGEFLLVTVDDAHWHCLAQALKEKRGQVTVYVGLAGESFLCGERAESRRK